MEPLQLCKGVSNAFGGLKLVAAPLITMK